ncbi:PfkB family carbohydrate kinase [uncultured Cohaesibacter sp.]|uniref:carbohydrate kinase family protein n=1 Tax=uncultured Cohaesibacter sp. TaxID=1002546 RepID=UPI0029C7BF11|nr:PfkB family carbohydrate kinase [uncultured Cohaesibacter sp.]
MINKEDDASAVLCVGRIYCDLIFTGLARMPVLGREVFADDMTIAAGGGAYISAAHFADVGRSSALVARLGLDPLSCEVEKQIRSREIGIDFLERAADAGPQVTVASVLNGERAFLTRRAGTAEPASLEEALHWPLARHLHIAEYATLAEIPDLARRAKSAGLTVSLDPSWDDDLIRSPDLLAACEGVDVFLPNLEEARAITGEPDISDMFDQLCRHFPVVALKAGADGAYCSEGQSVLHQAADPVDVVDTTGAGDAFNAGFVDKWLRSEPLSSCLAAGIATGSRAVQHAGGAS